MSMNCTKNCPRVKEMSAISPSGIAQFGQILRTRQTNRNIQNLGIALFLPYHAKILVACRSIENIETPER